MNLLTMRNSPNPCASRLFNSKGECMHMEAVIPWLDIGVKYSVLIFGTYYLFMKCVSEKRERKKTAAAIFFSMAMGISLICIHVQRALVVFEGIGGKERGKNRYLR